MLKIADRLEACWGSCEDVASEDAVRAALDMDPKSTTVAESYAQTRAAFEALENWTTQHQLSLESCSSDKKRKITHEFVQRKARHFEVKV